MYAKAYIFNWISARHSGFASCFLAQAVLNISAYLHCDLYRASMSNPATLRLVISF